MITLIVFGILFILSIALIIANVASVISSVKERKPKRYYEIKKTAIRMIFGLTVAVASLLLGTHILSAFSAY